MLERLKKEEIQVPLIIGEQRIETSDIEEIRVPHDHQHVLGYFHKAGEKEINFAIEVALEAFKDWSEWPWEDRLSIFLKAAELLAEPYRNKLNAATMLCQSKNAYQAEINENVGL